MIEPKRSISPRMEARFTGALYLVSGWAFNYGENTACGKLVVPGNAQATATNILANLPLFRSGLAADLFSGVLFFIVTLLLYDLLRPANRTMARIAAPFSLAGCIVMTFGCFLHLSSLLLLQTPGLSQNFTSAQLQWLAFESLTLATQGVNVSMIFFGCFNLFTGYLIFRSGFMPRFVGALLSFAGFCYLVNYFSWFLDPALGERLLRYLMWEGTAGEGSLILWLLLFGVNSQKWLARAKESRELPSGEMAVAV